MASFRDNVRDFQPLITAFVVIIAALLTAGLALRGSYAKVWADEALAAKKEEQRSRNIVLRLQVALTQIKAGAGQVLMIATDPSFGLNMPFLARGDVEAKPFKSVSIFDEAWNNLDVFDPPQADKVVRIKLLLIDYQNQYETQGSIMEAYKKRHEQVPPLSEDRGLESERYQVRTEMEELVKLSEELLQDLQKKT